MILLEKPQVEKLANGGTIWAQRFETFEVMSYTPKNNLPDDVINFGFEAPFLVIMPEQKMSTEEAVAFAKKQGFAEIAAKSATSVLFVMPAGAHSWDDEDQSLYQELIAQTKIHQYYEDGIVIANNRFTGQLDGYFIRGAKFRTLLFGFGKAADYIARNLLQTVKGEFLWGPGDITPAVCTLTGLTVVPTPKRRDIPVVSAGNSEQINAALQANCDHVLVQEAFSLQDAYASFTGTYRRWCGNLETVPDFDALGMVEEMDVVTVKTSPDNAGDDQGTQTHSVGYVAYYNKQLQNQKKIPLLFCFHGGGDSAMFISNVSGWNRIAGKYDFLLIAVENHLNSTATEMMELLEHLKKKYPIDENRIYATGFSMGGCKTWDMYQEYPEVFAGLAPMDATYEVGLNVYGQKAPCEINRNVSVPIFYAGGEVTPLPELPFQAEKCFDRMKYVFEVNRLRSPYQVSFDERENWKNPIWGIDGDEVKQIPDPSRGSICTMHYFVSEDGVTRTCFASISGQGHECRQHTCEQAWLFLSKFSK